MLRGMKRSSDVRIFIDSAMNFDWLLLDLVHIYNTSRELKYIILRNQLNKHKTML